jgi:hypothetical protein
MKGKEMDYYNNSTVEHCRRMSLLFAGIGWLSAIVAVVAACAAD